MNIKTCSKCQKEKEINLFSPLKKAKDGLSSWCKQCKKEHEQTKRIQNGIKEKIKPKIVDKKHKECLKCKNVLHINKFNKSSRGRLNRAPYCKPCQRQYVKDLKTSNPEKYKEKARIGTQKYRNSRREHWRSLHRIHQFNRKNKIKVKSDGTVTEEFMKQLYATENCYWCKKYIPIENRTAEHVIPLDKGGIHGISNLEMSCLSCNSSKLNFK